jgi:dTDP-L-rhamnose 4-epimerase
VKILLTGSEGFIGKHVQRKLPKKCEVVGIDSYEPRVHGDENIANFLGVHAGETPYTSVADADVIIHLAAQVGVADSMTDPFRYLNENTMETMSLLQTIQQAHENGVGPSRIVVASSMSVYGDPETSRGITEDHRATPASVYGLTKYDQERLCLMYGEMLGISTCALRFFNVYGPGQCLTNPYTGVLANFANWILDGKSPIVYEDGQQTRDFVYVEDVAEVVAKAALKTFDGVYNVCTGIPTTIEEVADELIVWLGGSHAPEITYTTRPGDIRHCIGDNSKLKAVLPEWNPRSFYDGIKEYAAYLTR